MCLIKKGEQKKRVAANPSPTSKHLPPPHSGNHMDVNARTLPPTRLSGWQQSLGVRVEPTHHPTWVRRVDFPFASVLAKAHNLFRPPNITARPSPTTPKHPPNSPLAGDLRHCRLFHAGKKVEIGTRALGSSLWNNGGHVVRGTKNVPAGCR